MQGVFQFHTKEYAAKCIAENRPSIDIMKLVGYRQDGLVMYGTNTATGGTVSTILAVTVLKTMLDENKLVDYKELIS